MGRRLEEYTQEELIEYIKTLKKQKRFGLVWEDKPEKVVKECETKLPVLKEVDDKAIKKAPGEPTNIIIEGDNYHALSVLNYTHAGKVDVIYIDPPYNTGNKDFIYNDCYVDKEDTFRHSKWLSFMEKRLRLAKNLLADDGVIFISINDIEQAHLKLLCDQIFGEQNFIANIVNRTPNQTNDKNKKQVHEYILTYGLKLTDKKVLSGKKICQFARCTTGKENQTQPVLLFPAGLDVEGLKDGVYNQPRKTGGNEDIELISGRLVVKDGKLFNDVEMKARWSCPNDIKQYVKKIKERSDLPIFNKFGKELKRLFLKGSRFQPILEKIGYDDLESIINIPDKGSSDLEKLGLGGAFSYPKSINLIKRLIDLTQKNAVVLDFFAGSGTTGQAVMELNKEDGGHRQFILVTNNEANGKSDAGAEGIAEKVTYPRIKTVITGIRPDGTKYSDGIPANLRYFKTDFVEKGKTTDDTREALMTECCDMIRIRENAFEHVASTPEYRFYKNDKVFVPIIFDQFAIAETWELVEELNTEKLPVHCYNFSYNRHANEEEIPEDTELEWTACSIPETVLEVYRKIFRKKEV